MKHSDKTRFFLLKLLIIIPFLSVFNKIQAQEATQVKGKVTDKTYANTTEIHKTAQATDEQILKEVDKDYGIGDEVRIIIAPPKTTAPTLENKNPSIVTLQNTSPKLINTPEISAKSIENPPIFSGKTQNEVATKSEIKKNTPSVEKPNFVSKKNVAMSKSSKSYYKYKKGKSLKSNKSFFSFLFKKSRKTSRNSPKNVGKSKYGCYKFK
jgi:hypothetical protein